MKKFLLLITACTIAFALKIIAQTFPPGFSQVKVGNVYYPTAIAVAPDGRLFVTEKGGKVKVVKNGAVLGTSFTQVTVDQLNERGLGGIALDPNFSSNNYVYIYYTAATPTIHNRLSRFTANGDVAIPGSEVIIHDFETSANSIHNAGGMVFGPDGKLYLAIGNDNVNAYSQDLDSYKGKVLRINPDFSVPSGNPYTTGSEEKKRIWAHGFRNPWTIAIQPGTGKLFVNDVGEGSWEEINDVTIGGKNFGWPGSQGNTTNPAYTSPVYTYSHSATGSNGGCAITGGTFFNPASTNYPTQYIGKYFFIDYCNDWINYLDLSSGVVKNNFATNLPGSGNYLKVGTDGNLYYYSIGSNSLYKIIYSSSNIPVVTTDPVNTSTPQGQQTVFSVTASGAPTLNYQWKKNNVNIPGAPNSAAYTINNTQPSDAGQYSVEVSNNYGSDLSNSATLTVTAPNEKPVANIITPTTGAVYRGGDVINFSGNATDPEDGTLPASAFSWVVEFHHDAHLHPGPAITPGSKTGSFPISATGEASANVYYRLLLIVEDSQGLKDTAKINISPVTSMINLTSQPSGLQLLLNGQPHTTPYSVLAVSGTIHDIGIITPQVLNDSNYVFSYWLHGGTPSQNFTVTDNATTYKGVFNSNGPVNIQTISNPKELNIFPNPSIGSFSVVLNMGTNKDEKVKIKIANSLGQEVYIKDCAVKNAGYIKELIQMDNSLPSGIYALQIVTEGYVIHTNIVLSK
ncbi:MAG: PQQ-dependent sugar dehydrogenase [Bacteroidota bacterium]